MSRRRLAFAATSVLLLLLSGCAEDKPGNGRGASAPVPVTTGQVSLSPWNDTLQALGTAKARESVTITAKVSELVEQVHFESGQSVARGAPLVTLRGEAQQAALAQARATFAEADQLYRRQAELAAQKLVSTATLDNQRAIRDGAAARMREVEAEIGDRRVRAPFEGVLGIRQVSPGSLVTPNTVIATLDDISRVYVDFQLPEADLASINPGDRVVGGNVAYPGREFEGVVSTIDARVDPGSRAITVRADFDKGDHALRPGMLLDVRVFRPERSALVVPEIAVVQVGRDSFVYRVKDDASVERADVKTGTRHAGVVEIIEGVKAGERIVVDGTGKLRPGARIEEVRPAKAEPAAAKAVAE